MGFSLRYYLDSLVSLVYPNLCIACIKESPIKGDDFCIDCLTDLPITTHFDVADNDFVYHFYGRVKIEQGAALLNFYKQNMVHSMLHRLKYKRKRQVADRLGSMLASKIKESDYFKPFDCIVPVPIHFKRKVKRGYNQSYLIAKAMAEVLEVEVVDDVLLKDKETATMTKKSRSERTKALLDTMVIKNAERLIGKHILVIDDVMTTGATLEACVLKLQEIESTRFSLATIAITKTI